MPSEPQVEELRERARAAARAEAADPSMSGYRSRYWQEWAERVADAVLDVLNPREEECRFCGGERAVMADEPLLAKAQHDLAGCLLALDSAQDALWTVTQEGDRYRWGRPQYDMTWDHVWECAEAALKDIRAALASDRTEPTDG